MNVQRLVAMTAITAAFAVSTAAQAASPNYDFLELSYQTFNDPSGSNVSSDHAYGIDGSYAFTEQFLGVASYSRENADVPLGTQSANDYLLGVGYRFPLTGSVDLVPYIAYQSVDVTVDRFGNVSNTNTGYDAILALRGRLTESFELDGAVDHSTAGTSTNTESVTGLFNFTPTFALGLGYSDSTANSQSTNAWKLAFRFYFN